MDDFRQTLSLAERIVERDERLVSTLLSYQLRSAVACAALREDDDSVDLLPWAGGAWDAGLEEGLPCPMDGGLDRDRLGMTLMGLMAREGERGSRCAQEDPMDLVACLDRCGVLEGLLDTEHFEGIEVGESETLRRASLVAEALKAAGRLDELPAALADEETFKRLREEFGVS